MRLAVLLLANNHLSFILIEIMKKSMELLLEKELLSLMEILLKLLQVTG